MKNKIQILNIHPCRNLTAFRHICCPSGKQAVNWMPVLFLLASLGAHCILGLSFMRADLPKENQMFFIYTRF